MDVFEEVEMVSLNVQHDSDGRVQREEGVIILAGLHDDGVPVADAVPRLEQRQRAAYHHGRILLCRHEDHVVAGGGARGHGAEHHRL